MPKDKLVIVKQLVSKALQDIQEYQTSSSPWSIQETTDRSASLHLTLGSVLRELGEFEQSASHFKWIFDHEKSIKEEKLVVPFAHYEQGILSFEQGRYKECRKSFKAVKGYGEYNFEFRLEFRIHMAVSEMDRRDLN